MPPKPAAKGAKPEPEPEPVVIEEVKAVGSFLLPDGSKYEGDYIEKEALKRREGKGTHTWNQGRESYSGEWLNDKMQGEGTYRFASKSSYQGSFKENLFHGQGTYTYADGSKYTGQWENNKMHGQGEYVDGAGVIWSGNFFNGLYDSGKTYVSLRPESLGI